jgi:hypothetical protein
MPKHRDSDDIDDFELEPEDDNEEYLTDEELEEFEAFMEEFPELDEYLDDILDYDDTDFYTEK